MENPHTRKAMAEDVKKEVLAELARHHRGHSSPADRALIEAVKNEALAEIHKELRLNPVVYGISPPADRALIESVKQEVMAEIEAAREAQEESTGAYAGRPDPALIQAVKNSVMAEMNLPRHG